jgi:hypothetical protein
MSVQQRQTGLVDRPFGAEEFASKLDSYKKIRDRSAKRPKVNYGDVKQSTATPTATQTSSSTTKSSSTTTSSSSTTTKSSTTATKTTTTTTTTTTTRETQLRQFLMSKLDNDATLVGRICAEFNKLSN